MGAEFYYVGYFNERTPFTDPRLYVWQAAIASYAQAITSRYENELRSSSLLTNEEGEAMTFIKTGDRNVLVVVRKCEGKKRYVISAALQPYSNNKGEVPDKKNVTVEFDGNKLTFEVRRQGSVYIYDNSDETSPVFCQLDSWQEVTHPDFWSHNFYFEAEINDSRDRPHVFTEKNTSDAGDFLSFTSYIRLTPGSGSDYTFSCRNDTSSLHYVAIRYRYKEKGTINVILDRKALVPLHKDKPGSGWIWQVYKIPDELLTSYNNILTLEAVSGQVEVDKVSVVDKNTF